MMLQFKTGVALALFATCAVAPVMAGQADDDFQVKAQINATCRVVANDVDFGTLTQVLGTETATSQITVTCSKGTPFTLSYNRLSVRSVLNANMAGIAPGNTDRIPYRLTMSANTGTGAGLAAANAIVINVAARIRAAANVRPDTYRNNRRVFITY